MIDTSYPTKKILFFGTLFTYTVCHPPSRISLAALLTMSQGMRTFNFGLLAALGYWLIMAGATPIGNRAPAEAVDRRELYVPRQQLKRS
jgi:hypothetical protein